MKDADKKTDCGLEALEPKELLEEERLFNEINLLRLEGYYFCFDPKAAAKRVGKQSFIERLKTPEELVERPLSVEPHPTYGHPGVLAYKVLQAVMKKLSDYGYPAPETVSFSQRELARLCGRTSFGGRQSQEFFQAAMQLNSTKVWCWFYDKETKEWQALAFYIIDSCLFSGHGEHIQQCVFHIHPAIVRSLNNRYAFCLNYSKLSEFEPIAAALYKRLFFHFSNLYSKKRVEDFHFTKDYRDICKTWLGGLKVLRYKSKIMTEQLGRHFTALRLSGLLKKEPEIERNAQGDGFNLTFHPGKGFFEDYNRFYNATHQLELMFQKAIEERKIQQPIELVAYFYRRLYQVDAIDETILSSKETSFAASLLAEHSFDEVQQWIDYAIREGRKTGFDMKSFGAIKVYGQAFQIERKKRQQQHERERQAQEERRERALLDQYTRFYRGEIQKIRQTLGASELEVLEAEARQVLERDNSHPLGIRFLLRVKMDQEIAKRYHVPSFEEWQARLA